MARLMERLSTFTPLGIRFWDPAFDVLVRDELRVDAYPALSPHAVRSAHRTRGGVYAFGRLPGLRELENAGSQFIQGSPPERHSFIVQARDSRRHFVPVALEIELPLPYVGVYLSTPTGSPAGAVPHGLHLYASPSRPVPASFATLRGELVDIAAGQPAAHAVLRVETHTGESWFGLADAQGRFVVVLPYPPLTHGFGGSPASPGHRPLFEQVWELSVSVRYEPGVLVALPGTDLPDYLSILQQRTAGVYARAPESGGSPAASLAVELRFDRKTPVHTDGLLQLLVVPSSA